MRTLRLVRTLAAIPALALALALTAPTTLTSPAQAQDQERPRMQGAPDRGADEGQGPYDRLILRGVTVIDGTGAPPR